MKGIHLYYLLNIMGAGALHGFYSHARVFTKQTIIAFASSLASGIQIYFVKTITTPCNNQWG